MRKNHVFVSFNLNNSEKHRLSFEDIFLGTLDTYAKKINPPSAVLGVNLCDLSILERIFYSSGTYFEDSL